ncbi:MAG: MFS transporter [bacterium]
MAGPPPSQQFPLDPHRWFVFGTIAAVYFFVYFHRVAPAVIVPDLIREFNADATALGIMASMYFYLYALEQPLVGYLSDLMGPRRVVGIWSLAAAIGCLLFALAPTLGWAAVGRGLLGLGVGGIFIPGMKAFSQWFPKREFSGLVGIFLAVGNLGALCATSPLAWMAQSMGWRTTFLGLGGLSLALAFLILVKLKDAPIDSSTLVHEKRAPSPGLSLVREVVFSLRFWLLFAIFFGVFGSYGTLQSLWATPYLMSSLGVERLQASFVNMLLPLGLILGAPILGKWVDRLGSTRRELLLVLAWVQTLLWVVLATGSISQLLGASVVLFLFGFTAGGLATSFWGVVRHSTAGRIMGVTTGLLNIAPFLGSGILQVATGAILDQVGKTGEMYCSAAYERAFLLCLWAALLPSLAAVVFRKKIHSGDQSPSSGEYSR